MQVNSVKNNTGRNIVKIAGIGALTGGIYKGGKEYLKQRAILKNGDLYLKNYESSIALSKRLCNMFSKGIQQASNLAKQGLAKKLEQAKEFVQNGKMNYKAVAKNATIGAVVTTGALIGISAIINLIREHGTQNSDK